MSVLTQDQWHLLTKGGGGNHTMLRLIAHFDAQRESCIASIAGGSFTFRDGRSGWYQTTRHGLIADPQIMHTSAKRGTAEQELTWKQIKAWSDSRTPEQVERARALIAQVREIQESFPPLYPGIGHTYAWDRKPRGTEEEIKADLAALDAVNAETALKREAYYQRMLAHDEEVREFFAPMAPTLYDDMILEQRASTT